MFSVLQGVCDPALVALVAALVIGCSGIPGLFLRMPGLGQLCATVTTILAALAGLPAALMLLFSSATSTYILSWGLPFGLCELTIDPLSAFFLIPVFLVAAAGSLFALGYWPAAEHPSTERGLTFFYGILASSMAILVTARNGVFFLMVWEIMALSAYFLLATEHEHEDVRRAGIVYLIATHTGSAALYVLFSLLASQSGSYLLPAAGSLSALPPAAMVIATAAFFGFGAKAGIMPFHIWLPSAHANAPSHVSAMMSGVMLKMGLYGIFRTLTFFHDPPLIWGAVLTVAGISSALLGIAFAVAQRDMKRLLACSSIENIGIITTGLGVAMLGISSQNAPLAYLGMAGALLHILNHSFFKPLLFLGSGVIIHATGTRNMNLMGGVAKGMPKVAFLFLIGSIAICGIPPLNGFVSEFLLYFGLFSQLQTSSLVYLVLLAPLLALVGGLAVVAFTKLYSSVFLGTSRSHGAVHPHEAGLTMLLPMALFALLCLLVGVMPQWALRLVAPAIASFMPLVSDIDQTNYVLILNRISMMTLILCAVAIAAALFWRWRLGYARVTKTSTWGCGYQRSSSRMQYGASSFSEMAVSVFNGIIRQKITRPALKGLFPEATTCDDKPSETLLERFVLPLCTVAGVSFTFLRRLQHGQMHVYMIYIFATLFVLMLWAH
ncbi:MAG: proton-conducting transporter membrane subunit [Desulfuromonadaceae bacterium]|nr:proton-conducting transporter membrane subunit [Desulfuromonadaceae bacterium]MDD5107324.1 proton-conducting transporter membrane subunit [Desulfuromonadaceae bacterium]